MRTALGIQIQNALEHRERSARRRRLPDPNNSPSSAGSALIDFNSNDYLSLSTSRVLRTHLLQQLADAPDILGSGGSRLLVNGRAHADLEARLAAFFKSDAALLFNSGFDANVGFFSAVPQVGDVVVYDEYIHASVHDGMRASRVPPEGRLSFEHNSLEDMRRALLRSLEIRPVLRSGECSVFVAVESLYSMDGTFAPLRGIVDLLDELFPLRNAYLVVDEAHSTGIHGPQGRGCVALLGLEDRVFARLHTFGKALAATGGLSAMFSHIKLH
jgi:8-amino-7-oxononanoate synthase